MNNLRDEFTGRSSGRSSGFSSGSGTKPFPRGVKALLVTAGIFGLMTITKKSKALETYTANIDTGDVDELTSIIEMEGNSPLEIAQSAEKLYNFVSETPESDPKMAELVRKFYVAGGYTKDMAERTNTSTVPWSAAFISYVVNPTCKPLPEGLLKGSVNHSIYAQHLIEYRDSENYTETQKAGVYQVLGDDLSLLETPRIADIVMWNRAGMKNGLPKIVTGASHAAIITDITETDGDYIVTLIGGNEANTILKSTRKWSDILEEIRTTFNNSGKPANKGKVYAILRHPDSM